MRQLSLWEGPDTDADTLGVNYLNWDADAIQGCYCDWGYGGPDCSLKLCPRGDDPITRGGRGAVVYALLSSDSGGSRSIVGAFVQKEGTGTLDFYLVRVDILYRPQCLCFPWNALSESKASP